LISSAFLTAASAASAQDIEPRAFSNAPIGVNFLIAGYAFTRGGLSLDPSLPVTDAHITTSNAALAYARVLDLWGMSAKFNTVLPYTWLSGSASFAGQPVERTVNGFADPTFRLSVNFIGAPALTLKEFETYKQDLIVGASLQVSMPLGQYDPTRLVNLGSNRWGVRPELGISKGIGPITLELTTGTTFYTANTRFYGDNTRSQDPIYSVQGHVIYNFGPGIWASGDATFFTGGSTTINGASKNDVQRNWRVGGTLSFPLSANYSVRLYASSGVSARTNNNYDLIGIALQYRWGGGL
jgi:hypothetical protein